MNFKGIVRVRPENTFQNEKMYFVNFFVVRGQDKTIRSVKPSL